MGRLSHCRPSEVGSPLCAVFIRAVEGFHAGSSALQAEDFAASRIHVPDPRKGLKPLYPPELPRSALPRSCLLSPRGKKKGPWAGWWLTRPAQTQLLIVQRKQRFRCPFSRILIDDCHLLWECVLPSHLAEGHHGCFPEQGRGDAPAPSCGVTVSCAPVSGYRGDLSTELPERVV